MLELHLSCRQPGLQARRTGSGRMPARPFRPRRPRSVAPALIPALLLAMAASVFAGVPPKLPRGRANLLLITVDTLRPDRLGCYGGSVETPAIDALAGRGVLFRRAFAHTTTTLPSHTNILLGRTPLGHGVHDNANFVVPAAALTLAEHLKASGYATAAFVGGFPLDSRFGLDQGFDVYDDELEGRRRAGQLYTERTAGVVVERACRWLEGRTGPWFLWVHCFDPHDPYEPPEPFRGAHPGRPYDGEIAYVDAQLARLFNALGGGGDPPENAVIVFTGDHGESLGEHGEDTHGYFAYNSTLWIPLIVAAPGLKPGRVDQAVAHADVFPTVCDLLDLEPPPGLHGVSLKAAAGGRKLPARDIYFESLYPHFSLGWAPLVGYLQAGRKFIESPLPELYDEQADFAELHNLAASMDLRADRERLAALTEAPAGASAARTGRLDRRSRDVLQSLGYLSGGRPGAGGAYGADDDVKILLPLHNRATAAAALYDRGRKEEAIALLDALLAERPDLDIAYTRLAAIYKRENRMEDALATLKAGTAALPDSLQILSNYLTFLNEAGRYREVIRLIVAEGAYPLADRAESWNDLGFAFMNTGESAKAAEAFAKALELDPRYAVVHQNLGALAQSAFLKSKSPLDYRKAVVEYRLSIRLDPADVWAWFGLGMVQLQGGEPREAARAFERVVPIHPDYAPALYNLGMAWFNAGERERALAVFLDFKARFAAGIPPGQLDLLEAMIQKCRPR